MTIHNNYINKPAGCEQFIGENCRIQVHGDNRSISGKVISVSSPFLTLEHKDGHHTLVRISEITIITPTIQKAT